VIVLGAALVLSTAFEARKASEAKHFTSIPRRQLEIGEILNRQQRQQHAREVYVDVGHGQQQKMVLCESPATKRN
jgi:hypothetical protein